MIKPMKLTKGDTIGIVSPSYLAERAFYEKVFNNLYEKGFKVKSGKNIFKKTYGYAASPEERAEDFNDMIHDENVRMILFGGGEVSNEILPLIDYKAISEHPKIICSYSDGTTVLNAITSQSGLVTYYGQTPKTFYDLNDYNYRSFTNLVMGNDVFEYEKSGPWKIVREGICSGRLIGGYLPNFALMINGNYLQINKHDKYILFLEEHEVYNNPASVSKYLSHLEQNGLFNHVAGILFGHYSDKECIDIYDILKRFGERYTIPVAICDDFGHGKYNAIIPIGENAVLDTNQQKLIFE